MGGRGYIHNKNQETTWFFFEVPIVGCQPAKYVGCGRSHSSHGRFSLKGILHYYGRRQNRRRPLEDHNDENTCRFAHNLPDQAVGGMTFDEICKVQEIANAAKLLVLYRGGRSWAKYSIYPLGRSTVWTNRGEVNRILAQGRITGLSADSANSTMRFLSRLQQYRKGSWGLIPREIFGVSMPSQFNDWNMPCAARWRFHSKSLLCALIW